MNPIEQAFKQALHFHQNGDLQQAEALYRQLLRINPNQPDVLHLLGVISHQFGRHGEAVAMIGRAIELKPGQASFHNHLGGALFALGKKEPAILQFKQALNFQPNFPAAANNLGVALYDNGQWQESIEVYQQALELNPDEGLLLNEVLKNMAEACLWDEHFKRYRKTLLKAAKQDARKGKVAALTPYQSLCLTEDMGLQKEIAESYAKRIENAVKLAKKQLGLQFTKGQKPSGAHKAVRVGYLCGDFRDHPTAHLISKLFEVHHKDKVEVFAYSFGENDNSTFRKRIEAACKFIDVYNQPNHVIARRIYDDKVDVLVDVMGYISHAKPEILALRPVPVQVNFLAYPGTMGASFEDYLVTDKTALPENEQKNITEKPIYMPDSYFVTDASQKIAKPKDRKSYGLPEKGFVFGCFNKPSKITPEVFEVWCKLLNEVKDSVLWLFAPNAYMQSNLKREAAARGIAEERLIFAERLPKAEHLARFTHMDLFLDCTPVCAHTTAIDALLAGVPLVTISGKSIMSRASSSILNAAGLPELVCENLEEYEQKALGYAKQPKKLEALKAKVTKDVKQSPLFDTESYATHLEEAFTQALQRWVAGKVAGVIEA